MFDMKECLERLGAILISLVYDGIYFRPVGLDSRVEYFETAIGGVESTHGITVHIKDLLGQEIP